MNFKNLLVSLCVVAFVLPGGSVFATQVEIQSLAELGSHSSIVVRGTVTGSHSYWNDQHTKIFTETTIQVAETFKGQPGGAVSVVQLGGTVDNIRVTAHGALQWLSGEEVVVFLEATSPGTYQVAGFSQGKFPVDRDARTGEIFVSRSALSGAQFVGPSGDKAGAGEIQRMPLQKFMEEAIGEGIHIKKN